MDRIAGLTVTQLNNGAPTGLPALIEAVGEDRFGGELLSLLMEICGAEHCALFHFNRDHPTEIASASRDGTDLAHRQISLYLERQYWRFDPSATEAQRMIGQGSTCLMRQDISTLPDGNLRNIVYGRTHIKERLLLCRGGERSTIGLSILRPELKGGFSGPDIARLNDIAGSLMAVLHKHADLISRRSDLTLALTSLDDIERCIIGAPNGLPRREAQVCARILYGVSSLGIALDLGIGEETVMTYRKRAYQRLGIATQRELLLWYVARWSSARYRGTAQLQ